jgi:WD40 repeat protein
VAFCRDGTTAITAAAGGSGAAAARVWDVPAEAALPHVLVQAGSEVRLAFSRDSRYLLTTGDRHAFLWDAATSALVLPPLEHPAWVTAVAFHPDGRTFLTGDHDGKIRLWERDTGRVRREAEQPGFITAAAFSPDGGLLLVGSHSRPGRAGPLLQFRDPLTAAPLGEPHTHVYGVWQIAFRADGRKFLTADGEGTHLWDRDTGREERHFRGSDQGEFLPDGSKVLLRPGGFLQVRDLGTGKPAGPPPFHPEGGVYHLAFSPDGRAVLVADGDKVTRPWDVATGKLLGPVVAHDDVYSLAFSPDGRRMATGGKNARVTLWEAPRPLGGSVERVRLWVEVLTGLESDAQGAIQPLSPDARRARHRRLEELGGPPAVARQ